MRLLLEVTKNLVEHVRAVVDVTTPSSASPSPPPNQSQSSRVWAAEGSTSCTARCANRCISSSFELRGYPEFHSHALRLMRMSAACAYFGRTAVPLLTTFTSSTSLAGFLTFSGAAGTAVRSCAQQQQVVCRALNPRDPSTIIPNKSPPAAGVARTPKPTADARCSFLACAGCGCRGWRPMDKQHGPRTSSIFVRPGAKSWAVVAEAPAAFYRGLGAFYDFRFAIFCSRAQGGGVGGCDPQVDRYIVELCVHVL